MGKLNGRWKTAAAAHIRRKMEFRRQTCREQVGNAEDERRLVVDRIDDAIFINDFWSPSSSSTSFLVANES